MRNRKAIEIFPEPSTLGFGQRTEKPWGPIREVC